jgi:alpha-L-fucosidase
MNSPFGRDVLKELAEACRKGGIAFGTYYSTCDWHHPDFPVGPARRRRRLRHAGAKSAASRHRPPVGNLHDHLPAVGMEAGRQDEVAQGVPPHAAAHRRRRRQPALQRRPHAGGRDRRPRQVERLKEMGAWLEKNGETIYGTRGGP